METVTVETYDGYRTAEYPLRFFINSQKVEIIRIEKQWLTPGCRCFEVLGDDGNCYILEYYENHDTWKLLKVNRP